MIILHRKFPPGGTVGQFLRKCSSTDNDVEWANVPSGSSLPDGGTTGQALRKASNADQDVSWQNDPDPFPPNPQNQQVLTKIATGLAWQDVPKELPTGGSTGQVLTKTASGQQWQNVPTELPRTGNVGCTLQKTSSGVQWAPSLRLIVLHLKDFDITASSLYIGSYYYYINGSPEQISRTNLSWYMGRNNDRKSPYVLIFNGTINGYDCTLPLQALIDSSGNWWAPVMLFNGTMKRLVYNHSLEAINLQ